MFAKGEAINRLVSGVLSENQDEWAVAGHRSMSVESLAKARLMVIDGDTVDVLEEVK